MGFLLPIFAAIGSFFSSAGPAIGAAAGLGSSIADIAGGGKTPNVPQITAPPAGATLPAPTTPSAPQIQSAADTQARGGGGLSSGYQLSLDPTISPDQLNNLKGYFA